jgi:hypothetical protein
MGKSVSIAGPSTAGTEQDMIVITSDENESEGSEFIPNRPVKPLPAVTTQTTIRDLGQSYISTPEIDESTYWGAQEYHF